jgi:predicted phosphodiesterase
MKLKLLSDLHLEHFCAGQYFDPGEGDILILAGDILCAKHLKKQGYLAEVYEKFLDDCSKNYQKVLYIKGNHEAYGYNYEGTHKTIQEHLPDNFQLMENDTVKIGDWHFLCATFWTDHNRENPLNMMENGTYMNDYKVIRITSNFRRMNPDDTLKFHKESKKYFEEKLKLYENDNVFIVTHMAPSYQSNSPRFRGESTNSAFCSNLDDWILEHPQIKYWVHGHLHSYANYTIGNCRVICNPVGYPREITDYNPNLEIEL